MNSPGRQPSGIMDKREINEEVERNPGILHPSRSNPNVSQVEGVHEYVISKASLGVRGSSPTLRRPSPPN